MINVTHAQVMQARALVRKMQANGETPNPVTVAIANKDFETARALAESISRHPAKGRKNG